jgi:hypothetical protein
MTSGLPKPPTITSIILGILACVVSILAIGQIDAITKWTGAALTFIPAQLRILKMVTPSQVLSVDFSTSPTIVDFPKTGAYNLYTDNYDLLAITDALMVKQNPAWLNIHEMGQEELLPVLYVTRGLVPYDTPFAAGRPIYYFVIPAPGQYVIEHPRRPTNVYFVPDYTTFHEARFIIAFAVEIILLLALILWLWYRRQKHHLSAAARMRKERRAEVEKFWQERRERRGQNSHSEE